MVKVTKDGSRMQISCYPKVMQVMLIDKEAKEHNLSRSKLLGMMLDKHFPLSKDQTEPKKEEQENNGTGQSIGNTSNGITELRPTNEFADSEF